MATYYLATTGDDSNNGTSVGTPWLTLGHALTHMRHADTLTVDAGTYNPPGYYTTPQVDDYIIDATVTTNVLKNGAVTIASGAQFSFPLSIDSTGTLKLGPGILPASGPLQLYGIFCSTGYGAGPAILTTANTIQVAGCLDFSTGNYYAHGIVDVNEKYYQYGYVDSSGNYTNAAAPAPPSTSSQQSPIPRPNQP